MTRKDTSEPTEHPDYMYNTSWENVIPDIKKHGFKIGSNFASKVSSTMIDSGPRINTELNDKGEKVTTTYHPVLMRLHRKHVPPAQYNNTPSGNVLRTLAPVHPKHIERWHKGEWKPLLDTKEAVTTLPGSLGVNPPQWTTAHKDVPPEWLSHEGTPCMLGGRAGFMRVVDGKLVCVPTPKESIKMDTAVITEGTNLHFASPSRTQIAKAHVYFDVRRRQVGLDNVRVSTIQGVQGNWFFDVSSHENNQFLDLTRLHNILPADVTVTASAPPTPQTASQDEVRNAIREMVEQRFNELIAEKA